METSSFDIVSTKQARTAELAKTCPDMVFTTLHHHIDLDWMIVALNLARADGATAMDCETHAEANLPDLLGRMKSGRCHAPPVRRHCIPKADGGQRPLGIPTCEDKVAQRAMPMLPGRSARRTICRARMASGPATLPAER